MKIGEYPRMSSVEDTDVFVFSRPSDGTKSIRVEDLVNIVAQSALPLISETLIEEITEAATEAAASNILDRAYPIGSIYMSMNATSPAELFGGTWEALQDRFLVGAGNSYAVNSTGGANTVTLSVAQMPVHNHYIYRAVTIDKGNTWNTAYPFTTGSSGQNTYYSDNAGGGQAHENRPPYRAVYMWKRTA